MTKFHDEFFNKGSPRHDKLVLETVENIKEIYNSTIHSSVIDDIKLHLQLEHYNNWIRKRCQFDCDISICNQGEQTEYCKHGTIAWKGEAKCKKDWDIYCEYLNKEKFDTTVIPNCKKVKGLPLPPNFIWNHSTSETEKLCKSGKFIIGYEDASFVFTEELIYNVKISESWVWEKYHTARIPITIIAECKPDLVSWGGPLRQLKTYIDLEQIDRDLSDKLVYGLFTTYSDVPTEVRNLLRKENIFVFTFNENKEKTQSLLFGEGF